MILEINIDAVLKYKTALEAADDTLEELNDILMSISNMSLTKSGNFFKKVKNEIWFFSKNTIINAHPSTDSIIKEYDISIHELAKCINNHEATYSGKFFTVVNCKNSSKKSSSRVLQIEKSSGIIVGYFRNANEANQLTGISNIYACLSGRLKSAGGYLWKYE